MACVVSSALSANQAWPSRAPGSLPLDHGVAVPARQAYSHSASLGRRWKRVVRRLTHFVYCRAAYCVMVDAGRSGSSPWVKVVVGS